MFSDCIAEPSETGTTGLEQAEHVTTDPTQAVEPLVFSQSTTTPCFLGDGEAEGGQRRQEEGFNRAVCTSFLHPFAVPIQHPIARTRNQLTTHVPLVDCADAQSDERFVLRPPDADVVFFVPSTVLGCCLKGVFK